MQITQKLIKGISTSSISKYHISSINSSHNFISFHSLGNINNNKYLCTLYKKRLLLFFCIWTSLERKEFSFFLGYIKDNRILKDPVGDVLRSCEWWYYWISWNHNRKYNNSLFFIDVGQGGMLGGGGTYNS